MRGFHRVLTKADRRRRNFGSALGKARAEHREAAMRQLIRKHGGQCALCQEQVSFTVGDPRYATIDHIQPLSKGGLDVPANWQLACAACNHDKGDRWEAPP